MLIKIGYLLAVPGLLTLADVAAAGDTESRTEKLFDWIYGDWRLTVGVTGMVAPDFEGAKDYMFRASPIISIGKAGPEARFTSRNDNISVSLFDNGQTRAGVAGRIIFPRDNDTSEEINGLDEVGWGAEIGGFAEYYPTDWLRVRGELRHGIVAYNGVVADLSADAFYDILPAVRLSGGPRLSAASAGYFDAYYGVDAEESAASGLDVYDPGGGFRSIGAGGAISWRMNENVTTSLFGEYARLLGPAADSSLVRERGSPNQFTVGVSASYRFDFHL